MLHEHLFMKFKFLLSITVLALAGLLNSLVAQNSPSEFPASPREWWRVPQMPSHATFVNATLLPRVHVKGNRFVDPTGEPLLFRGVSVADPDVLDVHEHWSRDLFAHIKEMGANIVRLPVHPAAWRARGQEKYFALLDQAADWCAELGIYIIIDWHSIGNLNGDLYQNPMYITSRQETFMFWHAIAQRYGKNTTIAFFELFNEPTTFSGKLGRANWSEWRETNEDLIAMIRSNEGEAVPLVAPFDWAYNLGPIIEDPIRAQGIGYVTHPYPNKRTRPWEPKWEEDFGFASGQYPVIATEIGFVAKPNEPIDDNHYGNRITRFLESHNISWLAWVYDPEWDPQILKSWEGYQLTPAGEFFKEAMHRPAAGHAKQEQRKPGDF